MCFKQKVKDISWTITRLISKTRRKKKKNRRNHYETRRCSRWIDESATRWSGKWWIIKLESPWRPAVKEIGDCGQSKLADDTSKQSIVDSDSATTEAKYGTRWSSSAVWKTRSYLGRCNQVRRSDRVYIYRLATTTTRVI